MPTHDQRTTAEAEARLLLSERAAIRLRREDQSIDLLEVAAQALERAAAVLSDETISPSRRAEHGRELTTVASGLRAIVQVDRDAAAELAQTMGAANGGAR